VRFSLKTLLVATAIVAVSCAGILYANRTWGACFFTASYIAILASIVAMLLTRGQERAFWIGFVVFAVAYFGYAMHGEGLHEINASGQGKYWQEPKLATSAVLLWLDDSLTRRGQGTRSVEVRGLYQDGKNRTTYGGGSSVHTLLVGHSIFTLWFALAGGFISGWVYRREVARHAGDPLARG
jgi:hypothetical protein